MKDRGTTPAWAQNLTTWINTHWQDIDLFNITGGDPRVVLENTINIAKRFGLDRDALALHWYEWDTLGYKQPDKPLTSSMLSLSEGEKGYDYKHCDTHCGFDTYYPEYFPPRYGFEEVSKQLQD